MLSQHDFLSSEECQRARDIIYSLKEHWVNRAAGFLPFYTLGAASYLDITDNDDNLYLQKAALINPILKRHFPLLYERLIEVLSEILKMPVRYTEDLSVPGFHIFLANKSFEKPIAATHFDFQFKSIKWNYDHVDYEHPISFTCALTLPHAGSGLNYWEITPEEAKNLSHADLEKLKNSKETHFWPYSLGALVLHQGLILHQIAPSKDLQPGDERITLQGHGLICDGVMRLYW